MHIRGAICPSCEEKLKQAHPRIAQWFRDRKSSTSPDMHVAWSYRGEKEQNEFFSRNLSKAKYPDSPHNKTKDGVPCSRALDVFRLESDGTASWERYFYLRLWHDTEWASDPVLWGGNFTTQKHDDNHFELIDTVV